jgi:uncharacterized integral membrane protein
VERGPEPPSRDGLDERQVRQLAVAGVLILVACVVLLFIVQNSGSVKVSFVFFSARISLIWVIVLSALVGAAAGLVIERLIKRRFFSQRP